MMSTFKQILTRTALLLCVISPPLASTSCDDKNDETKTGTVAVTKISVAPEKADMTVGETKTLTVEILPENATDKSYTLSSSNTAVATVEGDVVTAVSVGNAVITATSKDGSFTASCEITVGTSVVTVSVTGITVIPETLDMQVGETKPVEVTVAPEDATDKSYVWSSSEASVATVENNVVTALSTGTTILTATTTDGGFTATCTVTVAESFDGITATSAGGYYMGDMWGTGYENDLVYLLSGNVVENGMSFEGTGTALWLDLNLPKTGATTLPAGSYIPLLSEDQEQAFTWLPGTDMGAWGIIGTFVYSYASGDAEPSYIMAESGQVEVAVSGDTYTVNAVIVAGGVEYQFRYTGPLTLQDGNSGGGDGGDEEYDVVELTTLTQGEMDFYGEAYGVTGKYNNWTVYLVEDTFDFQTFSGTGKMMMLEFNTDKSVTSEITPGTYNIIPPMEATVDAMLPFTAVPGLSSGGSPFGTWYIESDSQGDMEAVYGATKGSITVAKSGETYTIDFDITDEDYGGIVRGSYTGPLSYYDGTAQSAPAAKRMGKGVPFKNAAQWSSVQKPAKRPSFHK